MRLVVPGSWHLQLSAFNDFMDLRVHFYDLLLGAQLCLLQV